MADLLLHPALPLLAAAVLVRVVPATLGRAVVVIAPVLALVAALTLDPAASAQVPFLGFDLDVLRADALAQAFGIVFALAALIAGIYGLATQGAGERTAALAYAGAAMGVVYAGDLLTFFLFWEIKAISSTFVILARRTHLSNRAGLRYLFLHIAGGKLLLAGILVHLSATGSIAFESFEPSAGAWLILAACALSAGIPPLHGWLKDAYPEATVAGTVFLSAFTTKAAVYALVRGFAGWEILIYLGVIMAAWGVIYAILENDIRRLLSYHIVSQVGFMVTAIGIGTSLAVNGAVAHAFAHILYKGLLLMGVGAVLYATGSSKASQLGGLYNRMKPVAVLYMIGAVSISSVPLFSGFVSKELIPYAAGQADLAWVVVALKVVSVGTWLSTGLKLPQGTFFGKEGAGPSSNQGARIQVAPVPVSMYAAMGLGALANVAIGLYPDLLYRFMPDAVDRAPYAFGPVVEKLQILTFTVLGFLLLKHLLAAKPRINLDVDWLYRRGPQALREALATRGTPTPDTGRDGHVPASGDTDPAYVPTPAGGGAVGAAATSTATTSTSASPSTDDADGGAQATTSRSPDVADGGAQAGTATTSPLARARASLVAAFSTDDGPADVQATWTLGAVVIGASLLLLFVSLL